MAVSYVNILQEKCQKNNKDLPNYLDVDSDIIEANTIYKCVCKLYSWVTEGSGTSKKMARQNAAKLMLSHVEKDSGFLTLKKNLSTDPVATKINFYAVKNKKKMPLFLDKQNEVGSFVVECEFDGYNAIGEGSNKKAAKENALEKIANHFNIHVFYNEYLKKKEGKDTKQVSEKVAKHLPVEKNPVSKLLELCQARNLSISFCDQTVKDINYGKALHFVMSCSVNSLTTQSAPNFSKKLAKLEAAQLMLEKLKETRYFDSPYQSPSQSVQSTSQSVQSSSKSAPRTIKRNFNSPLVSNIPKKKAKMKPAGSVLNTLKKTILNPQVTIKPDQSLFNFQKRIDSGVDEEDHFDDNQDDFYDDQDNFDDDRDEYDDLPSSGVNEDEDDNEEEQGDFDEEHSDDEPLFEADHSSDDGMSEHLPEANLSNDGLPLSVRRN